MPPKRRPPEPAASDEKIQERLIAECASAELRHRDTSERERRCIVAQRDALQCAEGITAASARAAAVISESIASDYPATLVTPIVSTSCAKFIA